MESEMEHDYYQVLGVDQSSSDSKIGKGYHQLSLKVHPDKNSDPHATVQFQLILAAYKALGAEESRANYNTKLGASQRSREAFQNEKPGKKSREEAFYNEQRARQRRDEELAKRKAEAAAKAKREKDELARKKAEEETKARKEKQRQDETCRIYVRRNEEWRNTEQRLEVSIGDTIQKIQSVMSIISEIDRLDTVDVERKVSEIYQSCQMNPLGSLWTILIPVRPEQEMDRLWRADIRKDKDSELSWLLSTLQALEDDKLNGWIRIGALTLLCWIWMMSSIKNYCSL